jgi:hypothetical protein
MGKLNRSYVLENNHKKVNELDRNTPLFLSQRFANICNITFQVIYKVVLFIWTNKLLRPLFINHITFFFPTYRN